jgi:hypothetical protein
VACPPGAGAAAGWSQLGPAGWGGGATTVEATEPGRGGVTGGAHVWTEVAWGAAAAAAPGDGAAGLTAFLFDFLPFVRVRRTLR